MIFNNDLIQFSSLRNLPSFGNVVIVFESDSLRILEQNVSKRIPQHCRNLGRCISIRREHLQRMQEARISGQHDVLRHAHDGRFANGQSTKTRSAELFYQFLRD